MSTCFMCHRRTHLCDWFPITTNARAVQSTRFYCVDLIEEIAQDLGFQYELYLTPDNQFGAQDDNGSWDGLVQQILVGVSEWNDSNLFC